MTKGNVEPSNSNFNVPFRFSVRWNSCTLELGTSVCFFWTTDDVCLISFARIQFTTFNSSPKKKWESRTRAYTHRYKYMYINQVLAYCMHSICMRTNSLVHAYWIHWFGMEYYIHVIFYICNFNLLTFRAHIHSVVFSLERERLYFSLYPQDFRGKSPYTAIHSHSSLAVKMCVFGLFPKVFFFFFIHFCFIGRRHTRFCAQWRTPNSSALFLLIMIASLPIYFTLCCFGSFIDILRRPYPDRGKKKTILILSLYKILRANTILYIYS